MLQKSSTKASLYAVVGPVLLIFFILSCSTMLLYYSQAVAQMLTAPSANYLQYTNPTYGIRIQYPEDWQPADVGLLSRLNVNNTQLAAEFHPEDSSVSVGIFVEKLLENITLDQYVESGITMIRENQPNFQFIELNKTTTLAGTDGYKAVGSGIYDPARDIEKVGGLNELIGGFMDLQPLNMSTMSFVTLHQNYAYTVVFSDGNAGLINQICTTFGANFMPNCASAANIDDPYSYYLPIAQKMIDSFEIIGQNQTNGRNSGLTIPNGTDSSQPNIGTQPTDGDPCSIVSMRLAIGEIPIEEYERLREILRC